MKRKHRGYIILGRAFNTGLHNLVRNFRLSVAATAVMFIALSVLILSWAANLSLNETVDARSSDFSVGLFFNDDIDQTVLAQLRSEVESKDFVQEVNYISKEEALQIFLQRAEEENDTSVAEGLDVVGENITPASFDIRFNDLSRVDEILALAEDAKYSEIIYDTSDNRVTREAIGDYVRIQNALRRATVISLAVFGAIAALIVYNTIQMAVYSRSDEIEIMKLIGATPNYIRGPFLAEAILYGIIAAVLAFSVAYSVITSVLPTVSGIETSQTIEFFSSNWLPVLAMTLGVGAIIGLLSSLLATDRYLKLKSW